MTPLPPSSSLDDVKVRIRQSYTNPNVGAIQQAVLKDGPRTFKIATLLEIINPTTGEFHHYSLKLDSIDRKKGGWFAKPKRSIRLEGGSPDEIEHLYRFLTTVTEGRLSEKSGELHLISGQDYASLEYLLDALPRLAVSDRLSLVRAILTEIDESALAVEGVANVFRDASAGLLETVAVSARLVLYRREYETLVSLVESESTTEQDLQRHLEKNAWMFGSEYSALLDRRAWTRDDRLDFMLRRTTDGFLEIIEIKKPIRNPLLVHDPSHDSYRPSSALSAAIGQVMRYIEEVDRGRDAVISHDGLDPLKIRARLIIGRDGDARHQEALRNLNAHLVRIEILTFDQLLRIADRVLAVFEPEAEEESDSSEDPPF